MRDRDYYRYEGDSGSGLLTGLILGGLIGAGLVLYLHSDKGKHQVKELKDRARDYRAELEKKLEEIKEKKVYPAFENIKSEIKDRIEDLDLAEEKPARRKRYNQ